MGRGFYGLGGAFGVAGCSLIDFVVSDGQKYALFMIFQRTSMTIKPFIKQPMHNTQYLDAIKIIKYLKVLRHVSDHRGCIIREPCTSSSCLVMQSGHLLTRSGLTYTEVSSEVCHDSFWQLGNSISLSWVVCSRGLYSAWLKITRMIVSCLLTWTMAVLWQHIVTGCACVCVCVCVRVCV